jgi:hypothetical protein
MDDLEGSDLQRHTCTACPVRPKGIHHVRRIDNGTDETGNAAEEQGLESRQTKVRSQKCTEML